MPANVLALRPSATVLRYEASFALHAGAMFALKLACERSIVAGVLTPEDTRRMYDWAKDRLNTGQLRQVVQMVLESTQEVTEQVEAQVAPNVEVKWPTKANETENSK